MKSFISSGMQADRLPGCEKDFVKTKNLSTGSTLSFATFVLSGPNGQTVEVSGLLPDCNFSSWSKNVSQVQTDRQVAKLTNQ